MNYLSYEHHKPAKGARIIALVRTNSPFAQTLFDHIDADAMIATDVGMDDSLNYVSGLERDEFEIVAWKPRNYPFDNDYDPAIGMDCKSHN